MSGGRKVRTYLFPAILSPTASARESSGVGCSSLAESLPVTNEAVKVNFFAVTASLPLSWVMLKGDG